MTETYKTPESRAEWQVVADMAHTSLCIDSARQYGLITGGPEVNIDRCVELLNQAASLGIKPHADAVERCMPALLSGEVQ